MSSYSSPENSHQTILQEPLLPDGILNALDDAVDEKASQAITHSVTTAS